MKTLIAVLGAAILGMTILCPTGCARHTKMDAFADYGFSFEYPAGYTVDERGNTEGEANSYSSGSMLLSKAAPGDSDFYYSLRWATTQDPEASQRESAPRAALGLSTSYLEESFETTGGSMQVGEIAEDSCSGHKMLHCYYKVVWSQGETVNGEIGVVYCSESQRWFELTTRSAHTENEAEALDFFNVFMSSFVCH